MVLLNWVKANESIFALMGVLSLGLFLVSLLIFPLIIIYLPHDYFVRPTPGIMTLNPLRLVLRILKNVFGVFLIIAGILMLFLPGQGLLSILLGVSLINFPGKRGLELRFLRSVRVRRTIAWMRHKADREPVILPDGI
jgi:hypothetical protein